MSSFAEKLSASFGEDAAAFSSRTTEIVGYDTWIKSRAKVAFESHARGAEYAETTGLLDQEGLPKLLLELRRFGGPALAAAAAAAEDETVAVDELECYCPANAKRWLTDFEELWQKWSAPDQIDRRLAQLPPLAPSLTGAFELVAERGSGAVAEPSDPRSIAVAEAHCIAVKRGLCQKKQLGKLALRNWKPRFLDLDVAMESSKITLWNSEKMKTFKRSEAISDVLGVGPAPGDMKSSKPFTLEITVADDSADGSHNFYVAFESAEEMDAWQRAIATHAAADAVRHGCKRGAALLTRLLKSGADVDACAASNVSASAGGGGGGVQAAMRRYPLLLVALQKNLPDVADLLLEAGADTAPLVRWSFLGIDKTLAPSAVAALLVKHGKSLVIAADDGSDWTLLHHLCREGTAAAERQVVALFDELRAGSSTAAFEAHLGQLTSSASDSALTIALRVEGARGGRTFTGAPETDSVRRTAAADAAAADAARAAADMGVSDEEEGDTVGELEPSNTKVAPRALRVIDSVRLHRTKFGGFSLTPPSPVVTHGMGGKRQSFAIMMAAESLTPRKSAVGAIADLAPASIAALILAESAVDASGSVHLSCADCETPMMLAIRGGLLDEAAAILALGASITALDKDGNTAVHIALHRLGVVEGVLAEGEDVCEESAASAEEEKIKLMGLLEKMIADRSLEVNNMGAGQLDTVFTLALKVAPEPLCLAIVTAVGSNGADVMKKSNAWDFDASCASDFPIHIAIKMGRGALATAMVHKVIHDAEARNALISCCDTMGDSVLTLAIRCGMMRLARTAVWAIANHSTTGSDVAMLVGSPLKPTASAERAAADVEVTVRLLTHRGSGGESALHLALRRGQLEFATYLLKVTESEGAEHAKALITQLDSDGATCLHAIVCVDPVEKSEESFIPCTATADKELLTAFLETLITMAGGATLATTSKSSAAPGDEASGQTPLHYCAARGPQTHWAVSTLLKSDPALAELRDARGDRLVDAAARAGNITLATLLLEAGASADAPNAEGMLPLHHAVCCRAEKSAAMTALVLRHTAYSACWGPTTPQAEMVGLVGRTAFQMAAAAGREDVLQIFIALENFEPNRRAEDGHTALTLSAEGLHVDVLRALIAAGADTRLRLPSSRETFVHVARRAAQAAYDAGEETMDAAKSFALAALEIAPQVALECFQADRDGVTVAAAVEALTVISVAETASERHARVAAAEAAAKAEAEAKAKAEAEAEAARVEAEAAAAAAEAEAKAAAAEAAAAEAAAAEAEAVAAAAEAGVAAEEAEAAAAAGAQEEEEGGAAEVAPPAAPEGDASEEAVPASASTLRRGSSVVAVFDYSPVDGAHDELGERALRTCAAAAAAATTNYCRCILTSAPPTPPSNPRNVVAHSVC